MFADECYKIYNVNPQQLQTLDPICEVITTPSCESSSDVMRWGVDITDIETSIKCIVEEEQQIEDYINK